MLAKTDVKQLVVSEKGVPSGIITHKDLIKSSRLPDSHRCDNHVVYESNCLTGWRID